MSYEIPQALKYEEKVIFGLTMKQLAYLGTAGLLSAIIFKTQFSIFLKIPVCLLLVSLAGTMAFLKLDSRIADMFNFYKKKQKLGYFDKELGKLIQVKSVSENCILLKDKSLVGILQVRPTNFSIKSKNDKNAIIKNFQQFLNSLDFPIQILVRTVNANIDFYIEHLRTSVKKQVEKRKNTGLERLFNNYVEFLEEYLKENAVKNKLFYVILRSKEQSEIETRLDLCRDGLEKCGLASKQLKTGELINLLSSFFGCNVRVGDNYLSPITIFKHPAQQKNQQS